MEDLLVYFTPDRLVFVFVTLLLLFIAAISLFPLSGPDARPLPYKGLPVVVSVSTSPSAKPSLCKKPVLSLTLKSSSHPVHLLSSELQEINALEVTPPVNLRGNEAEPLLDSLRPGGLGEDITTAGLDLLALGAGSRLHFINPPAAGEPVLKPQEQPHAIVRVTGLRGTYFELLKSNTALQESFLDKYKNREFIETNAGVMAEVEVGGVVQTGTRILVQLPKVHQKLSPV